MKNEQKFTLNTKTVTLTAMLSAISIVLYFIAEIPIIPMAPHLKMDLSDIPALIASMILSPIAGIMVELIKNLIHLLRTGTFGIGEAANFAVGTALVLGYTYTYRFLNKKNNNGKTGKIISVVLPSIVSLVSIIIVGVAVNAALYPVFMSLMGAPIESVWVFLAYLWSTVIMNTVKAVITLAVALPITYQILKRKKSWEI